MSNPPYPPSEPGNGTPEQPQYGQRTPQPGETPQFGQPSAPQYGQQAPQYGQQAPQYGQPSAPQYGQPAAPYGQGSPWPSQQPAPSSIPQLVNLSFWLIVAAAAIWIISLLMGIAAINDPAMRNMINAQLESGGADIPFEDIKGFLVGTLIVFAVIGAGLYALVAFNVRKGKNWARILGTVFAGISLLSIWPPSLATLSVLFGVAAVVLLYLPAAVPYFQRQQPFANPYNQPGNPYGR